MTSLDEIPGHIEAKKRLSLRYSILDGAFCSAMIGLGESFLSTFAVFLKATSFQLGLIGSLPPALGALCQLFTNRLLKLFGSRKKFVCLGVGLQAFTYIPIALVFFFGELRMFHLILFVSLYFIFGMIQGPVWNSWMGDLVSEDRRGTYFGRRNRVAGLVTFLTFLLGGYILQKFTDGGEAYAGFAVLFGLSLTSRITSLYYLSKQYDPPFTPREDTHFTFLEFLRAAPFRNFGLYALFMAVMSFSLYISTPFFTPYMLNDLKMSYQEYALVNAATIIIKLMFVPVWGKVCDRYGSRKVLTLTGFLMPAIPLLWMISHQFWYIVAIQAYSGFVWAGFELASFAFIYDCTSPQRRAICVAYLNVMNGAALLLGALAGSALVKYNHVFWSPYILVFLVSGIMRYATSIFLLPRIKEMRKVEDISHDQLLYKVVASATSEGILYNFIGLKKRVEKIVS
jgi:MFS family permease